MKRLIVVLALIALVAALAPTAALAAPPAGCPPGQYCPPAPVCGAIEAFDTYVAPSLDEGAYWMSQKLPSWTYDNAVLDATDQYLGPINEWVWSPVVDPCASGTCQ